MSRQDAARGFATLEIVLPFSNYPDLEYVC